MPSFCELDICVCGIVGAWSKRSNENPVPVMLETLRHRGPDDQGIWKDGKHDLFLGHARLSIVDLSSAGHQPMVSPSGRYVIVFNGEIYNFRECQKHLPTGTQITGHSDTEILLAMIDAWGLDKALEKSTGMFAFALWDQQECCLYLARDRFGEKPLYYGHLDGDLLFASELKALKAHPKADRLTINRHALVSFVRYGYVPTPYCIYDNFHKLQPGTYLCFTSPVERQQTTYWSAVNTATQAEPFSGSFAEAVDAVDTQLTKTLSNQMLADVPLGAFLSGGIDSSTIVALMQAQHGKPVQTFSIGFNEQAYNEAEHARAVAQHLGTNHYDLYVDAKTTLDVIPKLSSIYDEPFADASQIPTYLVSKIAKQRVTVCLSGDAGDELFGGYNRYAMLPKVRRLLSHQKSLAMMIRYQPHMLLKWGACLFGKRFATLSEKMFKLKRLLSVSDNSEAGLYRSICSQYDFPEYLVQGREIPVVSDYVTFANLRQSLSTEEWMMLADTITYLNDDILTKIDRASMAISLETRAPFLDHQLFELAWQLPLEYKMHNGIGKRVLREVLYRYVPKSLIDRPKQGFSVPIAHWLRYELSAWAEDLLSPAKLAEGGYFYEQEVQKLWQEHMSEKRDWSLVLWNILMFQAWVCVN